jgi:hypothetical protein
VKGLSPYGEATIETCELWREGLLTARGQAATIARVTVGAWQLAKGTKKMEAARQDLLREGGVESPGFPSVVRAVFERITGHRWKDLVKGSVTPADPPRLKA